MGQKTNPISNRIGITRGWDSNWCGGNYAEKIAEDYEIRKYLSNRLAKACMHGRRKWQPTPVFLPG